MPGKMVPCMHCPKVMRSDNLKNHIKTHRAVLGAKHYAVGKKRKIILSSDGNSKSSNIEKLDARI